MKHRYMDMDIPAGCSICCMPTSLRRLGNDVHLVAAAAAAFGPISNNPTQPRQSIKTIFNLKRHPSSPPPYRTLPPLDHSRQSTRAAA